MTRRDPGYTPPPETPSTELDRRTPTAPNYQGAMGAFGSLSSFAKRRAAERYRRELEALESAVEAATRLNQAKAKYAASVARVSGDNLQKIALEEQWKVDRQLAEEELRRADAYRRQQTFEKRAAIEDENLEAELAEAKLRRKRAENALHGITDDEPSSDEKRRRLEREIDELFRDLEALDSEFIQRTNAGTVDDAYERTYNAKRNRLQDKLNRKMAEEEAL